MIVAIDGPAGSGKSTTARAVAERLNYLYLDTGAMYRAVALAFLDSEVPVDEAAARDVVDAMNLEVVHAPDGEMALRLNGSDVTEAIRSEAVGKMASRVSTLPVVRRRLVEEQRRIAMRLKGRDGVVLEGRDTGTKVFPEADLKIFLVADVAERARRRHEQLRKRGANVSYHKVLQDLERRDAQDMERTLSPLVRAEDAVELDTTHLSIDEQVQAIVDLVRQRG